MLPSVRPVVGAACRRCPAGLLHRGFSTSMRAAVLGAGGIQESDRVHMPVETLQFPRPKRGEVLVKNAAAGVCHTDLHIILNHIPFPKPAVVGHEISGEVVELGEGYTGDLQIGDRVIGTFIMPCGHCPACSGNQEDICETFFQQNRLKGGLLDGTTRLFRRSEEQVAMYSMAGFAEYSVVPERAVHRLPKELPTLESSIVGCALFTAYGAAKNAGGMRGGEDVVVYGVGGVGANLVQVCRALGAKKIIAVDRSQEKLDYVKERMGATDTVLVEGDGSDVVERVTAATTGGRGANIAFEVIGRSETVRQAVLSCAPGGRAVLTGLAPPSVEFATPLTHVVRRKIEIHGSFGAKSSVDTPEVLQLLREKKLTLEAISKRYSLETVSDAYEDLRAGKIVGKAIVEM